MAKNLRTKIPESDTMYIHDVNTAALDSFVKEVGKVTVAKNVREVAENTVRYLCCSYAHTAHSTTLLHDDLLFS